MCESYLPQFSFSSRFFQKKKILCSKGWLADPFLGSRFENRPAHIYAFPFEPNPDWSAYYVSGEEIQKYIKRVVAKHDLARGILCGHRVSRAEFDEERGKWNLQIQHGEGKEVVHDECDILISGRGFLSSWRWPSIPGLDDFSGKLCHSASWWGRDFDWKGKRVAIIGNGSSGIQILPQMAGTAAHVTNFIRRSTYITPGLGSAVIGGSTQYHYSDEEKRRFREDPEELKRHRKEIQAGSNRNFDTFVKNSTAQAEARQETVDLMAGLLKGDEDLIRKLTPEYEVGCRRATPGPGYLEAFTRDDVRLVTEGIEKIEAEGVRTRDGELHRFDAIVCATGFDVSHRPTWPLVGRKGATLAEAWKDEPVAYLSLCAAGFPNFFVFSGPNAPVGHGSLMAATGYSADYMARWMVKIAEEDIKFIDVKPEIVAEFDAYADEIMQTLVWSGGCQSWYVYTPSLPTSYRL